MDFTFPEVSPTFYQMTLPVLTLCSGAILLLLMGVSKKFSSLGLTSTVAIASLGLSFLSTFSLLTLEKEFIQGSYISGNLAFFGQFLITMTALIICLLFKESPDKENFFRGEILSLFLMVVAGMQVLVASDDIVTMFVGLELSSMGLYVLVGYITPTQTSQEGAIKYFVLGSVSAALLLFGFALLYAGTGSLRLSEIVAELPKVYLDPWIQLGGLFTLCGLGFKLALAPFHIWSPDAYEAAPTGITAMMATAVKVMICIFFMRLFAEGFQAEPLPTIWQPALVFLAMLSIIAGNVMALVQTSLKRMLAYSSIAHSGYIACAICAMAGSNSELPYQAILFYLVSYTIVSLGVFAILSWLETSKNRNIQVADLIGLSKSHPWTSFALAVFMFSFAGMPPSIGFIGKFLVFNAALKMQLYALVIAGAIGSTISLFYYLRIIVNAYFKTSESDSAAPLSTDRSRFVTGFAAVTVVLSILLGVAPNPILRSIKKPSMELIKPFYGNNFFSYKD